MISAHESNSFHGTYFLVLDLMTNDLHGHLKRNDYNGLPLREVRLSQGTREVCKKFRSCVWLVALIPRLGQKAKPLLCCCLQCQAKFSDPPVPVQVNSYAKQLLALSTWHASLSLDMGPLCKTTFPR